MNGISWCVPYISAAYVPCECINHVNVWCVYICTWVYSMKVRASNLSGECSWYQEMLRGHLTLAGGKMECVKRWVLLDWWPTRWVGGLLAGWHTRFRVRVRVRFSFRVSHSVPVCWYCYIIMLLLLLESAMALELTQQSSVFLFG